MKQKSRWKKGVYVAFSIAFWLCLWQMVAAWLDKPIFLPYPGDVWKALVALVGDETFLTIVGSSLAHIGIGFSFALVVGLVLAVACSFSDFLAALLLPAIKLIKTVPVVSFVILVLLWVDAAKISIVISFLIVLPVIYENVRRGIRETNPQLLEMSKVFGVGIGKRLRYIFLPSAIPYSTAACSVGLSLCWKAGIAAEVIGLAKNSIGRQLYDAKLYLDAEALFAWTIVVIVVSVVFEWLVMVVMRLVHVWLADNTLRYYKSRFLRFVLGLPKEERAAEVAPQEEMAMEEVAPQEDAALKSTGVIEMGDSEGVAAEPTLPAASGSEVEQTLPSANVPIVSLENIGKVYDGKAVLSDVSLKLCQGDVVLLRGASGSGKTTLLRILLGLTEPDSGKRVTTYAKPAAVFQEDRLCEAFCAYDNVKLAIPERSKEEILADLRDVGIDEAVRKPTREFSGGMKRRVAWVRALQSDWNLLVLDEPFTGLDSARIAQLVAQLKEKREQGAIAIVTHNTSEITKIYESFSDMKELQLGR